MSAHTPSFVLGVDAHRATYSSLTALEEPLYEIQALCFALDAIAATGEVDQPAKSAIVAVTAQIEALAKRAEGLRDAASKTIHSFAYPRGS